MAVSTHPQTFTEILSRINQLPSAELIQQAITNNCIHTPYFKEYMELAVNDVWTTMDATDVKLTPNPYHESMAGALLLNRQTWNIVRSVILVEPVSNHTKVFQYKSLMEMLSTGESDIFKAVLTKTLPDLYTNITHELICKGLSYEV